MWSFWEWLLLARKGGEGGGIVGGKRRRFFQTPGAFLVQAKQSDSKFSTKEVSPFTAVSHSIQGGLRRSEDPAEVNKTRKHTMNCIGVVCEFEA